MRQYDKVTPLHPTHPRPIYGPCLWFIVLQTLRPQNTIDHSHPPPPGKCEAKSRHKSPTLGQYLKHWYRLRTDTEDSIHRKVSEMQLLWYSWTGHRAEPQWGLLGGRFLGNVEQTNPRVRCIHRLFNTYKSFNSHALFLPKIVMIFLTVTSLKFLLRRKSASWPPRIPTTQATKKGREDRNPFWGKKTEWMTIIKAVKKPVGNSLIIIPTLGNHSFLGILASF